MNKSLKAYKVQKIAPVLDIHQVAWDKAFSLCDFTFPWNHKRKEDVVFKALWDGVSFYFRFDVNNCKLNSSQEVKNLDVVQSERVEIFFRKNREMSPYYCLEMDTNSRILDYSALFHRDFDFSWVWPKGELFVESIVTKKGYMVMGQLSLSSLKQLGLWNDGLLEVGLFRANAIGVKEQETQFDWSSWVKPLSSDPDFHIPSAFGLLAFSK